MQLKLYRDAEGYPNVDISSPYEIVGLFLERDVQSPATGQELLTQIDHILAGEMEYPESTGNAYLLILTPTSARIEPLFSEEPEFIELPLADFRQVVLEWTNFLQS